jgi:hypothetical protein
MDIMTIVIIVALVVAIGAAVYFRMNPACPACPTTTCPTCPGCLGFTFKPVNVGIGNVLNSAEGSFAAIQKYVCTLITNMWTTVKPQVLQQIQASLATASASQNNCTTITSQISTAFNQFLTTSISNMKLQAKGSTTINLAQISSSTATTLPSATVQVEDVVNLLTQTETSILNMFTQMLNLACVNNQVNAQNVIQMMDDAINSLCYT